jgi:hypothetical protein
MLLNAANVVDGVKGALITAMIDRLRPYRPVKFKDVAAPTFALIGAGLVGAAVALLFAPMSGKQLRSDIRQKALHAGNSFAERSQRLGEVREEGNA